MADPQKVVPNPSSVQELNALLPNPGSDGYIFFENVNTCTIERTLEFRKLNCWWMIEISYLVYGTSEAFVTGELAKVGLGAAVFGFNRSQPPHILVAHNNEIILVAFRGTRINDLPDILADVSFFPELTSNGLVHRGFQNALFSGDVWEDAKRHVSGIAGNQTLFFTGHSLGAALATIAFRGYRDPLGRQRALYTFGSPRVGDALIFCGTYPPNDYRIVNDEDVVTHVPTPPWYGHVGSVFGPDGRPLSVDLWEQFERRFSGIGEALGISGQAERTERLSQYFEKPGLKPVADHAPRCYATKIWNAV
jgi:hypothetical protein